MGEGEISMNNVVVFNNEEFGKVRTVTINNEPWFVGRDVAVILGYKNPNEAVLEHVDEEDKFIRSERGREMLKLFSSVKEIQELFGRQDNWFINESGVYSLIFGSKLPSAKKFKRWVTSEVLPALRKHGFYGVERPDSYMIEDKVERALAWAEEEKERQALASKVKVLAPKAQITEDFIETGHAVGFRDLCKELEINERHMAMIMNLIKFAYRQGKKWKPYSETMKKGYAIVKDCFIKRAGFPIARMFITMEGKAYLKKMVGFYKESGLLEDWSKGINTDYQNYGDCLMY